MAKIKVEGDRGTVEIVTVDEEEGLYGWKCSCGWSEMEDDDLHDTLSDVINEAEIHADLDCKGR